MPLKYSLVEGKNTGLYLAYLGAGVTAAPTPVTVTVDTAGATAGDTTIPITDPGTNIPKNTVLTFDDANSTTVVVTADFTAGAAGNLEVEDYDGASGDGIANALTSGDAASWDGLYTAVGTENAPFSNNAQTNELTAVTYGSGSGVSVSVPNVQSKSPQTSRTGLLIADGQLTQDLITYGDGNGNWYAKHVTPDATGSAYVTREGVARVTGVDQEQPADGLVRLSYTVTFIEEPTVTFAAP